MGDKTGISWTDATWNPVRGCSRVSAGCVNCYAEQQAARIVRMGKGRPTAYDELVRVTAGGDARWTGKVTLDPKTLAMPLRWSKPRRVFVNSMSDLFHESLTNEQIAAVFGVMAAAPQHTFQVLTKRAKRMRDWFTWITEQPSEAGPGWNGAALSCARRAFDMLEWNPRLNNEREFKTWPLPNVWIGVSVENQAAADERIPELAYCPAVVHFLSCEPLIGSVSLGRIAGHCGSCGAVDDDACGCSLAHFNPKWLDWVIAGCESGPGARSCDVDWLRSLRDQCDKADVAFFLKQAIEDSGMRPDDLCDECGEATRYHVVGPRDTLCSCACTVEGPEAADWHPDIGFGEGSKRKTGGVVELPYLDGRQHAAFPEVQP